jgi:hypothetical protein
MDTSNLPKVIRNRRVAVLYSPGFGAGWYSWNTDIPACLFDPEIVSIVESDMTDNEKSEKISELAEKKWGSTNGKGYFYSGGAEQLSIEWVPQGQGFEIAEYDGSEAVRIVGHIDFIIA